MDDIVREFLVESHEGLDRCGFLGFTKLEAVSHVGENLLSLLRDGRLELSPEITSAVLQLVDAIRQILGCIESEQREGEADYAPLVELLRGLASPGTASRRWTSC